MELRLEGSRSDLSSYHYGSAERGYAHGYLLPAIQRALGATGSRRVFEIGCGSGYIANCLTALGYDVTGIDPSEDGIRLARKAYPLPRFYQADAYEPLADRFGRFPAVISLEVVEHVMWPRKFIATCRDLLEPHGTLILSTPYHGWLKNVAVALSGNFDKHVNPLWDGGHIKFWSERTLAALLAEAGFRELRFVRVGRIAPFAKSMIAIARR
jgi:2-polyprenyl-3-methyl-5-hydroxy-6-metoxy-1,4-benzoquinol methylase